jgi:predicted RNA-binding Zn-ribbon protein involved in translation (DUF1610 family)
MPYPTHQLWALALPAVITELDNAHHTALGGWGDDGSTRPWCTKRLADFYGVESAEDLQKTATYLFQEGHTLAAREKVASLPQDPTEDDAEHAVVRAHRAEIERAGVLAWDTARLVAVLGWGVWAGYMPEMDAWQVILVAAARAQKTYDSWASFADGYELGRLYWAKGELHAPTARILEKLKTDPKSPWTTLPWTFDLGVVLRDPSKTRFKRTVCPACGAPKTRPSATAFVYCDFCGALSDYDFAKACEKPLARPGPVYEQLVQALKPETDLAFEKADVDAYRAVQWKLFDAWIEACPDAAPPRVRDPVYRKKYAAFLAEGATVTAFDEEARQVGAAVAQATAKLSFVQPKPGVVRVDPPAFRVFEEAVFLQLEHINELHEARGVFAMHPDGASAELQKHMSLSMFVQGWLPMLDEPGARELLARTGLVGEYIEADTPAVGAAACGACGGPLGVLAGAKRMVCDHCGCRLDVEGERARCSGCGAGLAAPEDATTFSCPSCKAAVQRVAMMTPA